MAYIFDLDQTIVDSSIAESHRRRGDWKTVYSLIPQFTLYDGIKEVIETLHNRGESICVVTSSPKSYCTAVLQHFGINIDYTVCYHDTKLHKPHPEPILEAIRLLEESPNKIVSIGDAENDITASIAAGTISCLACWGGKTNNTFSNAHYVFKTVADLKEFIDK